jgi:hypothetical protein
MVGGYPLIGQKQAEVVSCSYACFGVNKCVEGESLDDGDLLRG